MKTKRVFAGLGVVAALAASALPLSSYAATGTVAVDFTVGSTLSMTIDDSANGRAISVDSITPGETVNTDQTKRSDNSKQTSVIKVTTNNATGYNLVASLPNNGALTRTGGGTIDITAGGAATIAEAAAWGIRTYNDGANAWNNYLAFTKSSGSASATVNSTSAPTTLDRMEVGYSLKTASNTPSGNYATTVTYTATAN